MILLYFECSMVFTCEIPGKVFSELCLTMFTVFKIFAWKDNKARSKLMFNLHLLARLGISLWGLYLHLINSVLKIIYILKLSFCLTLLIKLHVCPLILSSLPFVNQRSRKRINLWIAMIFMSLLLHVWKVYAIFMSIIF